MPHTMRLSVWLMPARNNTSATNRHAQRFLWIVVRSDCKKNYVTEINSRNSSYEMKHVTDPLQHSKNSIMISDIWGSHVSGILVCSLVKRNLYLRSSGYRNLQLLTMSVTFYALHFH